MYHYYSSKIRWSVLSVSDLWITQDVSSVIHLLWCCDSSVMLWFNFCDAVIQLLWCCDSYSVMLWFIFCDAMIHLEMLWFNLWCYDSIWDPVVQLLWCWFNFCDAVIHFLWYCDSPDLTSRCHFKSNQLFWTEKYAVFFLFLLFFISSSGEKSNAICY